MLSSFINRYLILVLLWSLEETITYESRLDLCTISLEKLSLIKVDWICVVSLTKRFVITTIINKSHLIFNEITLNN